MRFAASTIAILLAGLPSSYQFLLSGKNHVSLDHRQFHRVYMSNTVQDLADEPVTVMNPEATEVGEKKASDEGKPVLESSNNGLGDFKNDGPFAFMTEALDMIGVKEGKAIIYGPIAIDVDESKRVTDEESFQLRKVAAENLQNINKDERERRANASKIAAVVTAVYASAATLLWDHGGFEGHFLRFLTVIPMFLAFGYSKSAETGLCNIAQAGLWDVDGNGLRKIEDPNLAQAILQRVNNMNIDNGIRCIALAGAFALLPQSTSVAMVSFGLLYAGKCSIRKWHIEETINIHDYHRLTPLLCPIQSFILY